jgi:uncharacterized protein (TIGR03089 family)
MAGNPMGENPVVAALARRTRRGGSEPLLTWYRPESGGRTELSVRTFANWVDKAANLLESLGVEGTVAGPVGVAHPGHWMSLLLPLAAWQNGCRFLAGDPDADTELVVVGPDDPHPSPGAITLACSLHPFALGLRDLPDGVLDFSGETLAQPDAHWARPVGLSDPAWAGADGVRTHAATAGVAPQDARVLVRPSTPWETLAAAVIGPVLGAGSAVVVEGPVDADALTRIAAAERATTQLA